MHGLYSSTSFEEKYTYSGSDLGANWTPQKTFFRLWAPTAQEVTINIYCGGDSSVHDLHTQIFMTPDTNGTWIAELEGDWNGFYYTYLVMVEEHMQEACDPYAKSTGVNGTRAMILDMAAANPDGWEFDHDPHTGCSITDAVIYEAHVRDFTMHRSCRAQHKGLFLGVTESGLTTKQGVPIGLDHMKQLGITHLHLLPVFDYGYTDESKHKPQYNWGYDPVNFNVPEGSYASDPFNGAVRVREMKQMVKNLHDNGISVVMDVVYNHVFEADDFCFNKIVPGYFSRTMADGSYSNGSCCGNDTASERSMVRKYIVDSVKYWAAEYHIDGFRFDLVGLIDIQTIRTLMDEVHKTHPNVIFYGEGWSMNTAVTKPDTELTVQSNSSKVPGFAFFSDTIRDLMRGSVFYEDQPGFVSGAFCSKNELHACFMGVPLWAAEPEQCVNYVSCHDNHTLFDRLSIAAPEAPRDILVRMNNLAAAFSILSQGVPFFQAGEELLRTKPGKKGFDHNSYRSPDRVNAIRWEDLDKDEFRQTSDFYRGLLAFRKAHPGLRLKKRSDVYQHVHPVPCENEHTAAFLIDDGDSEIFAIFNADTQEAAVNLPEGNWTVNVQDMRAGTAPLAYAHGCATAAPLSAMVLTRKKPIDVVAALIWEKDRFLICQRPANKARGLLWEFAGGKVEPGETLQQALVRECAEELAIELEVRDQFMQVVHQYPDMLIRLTLFHCVIPAGFPQPLEHNALRWIRTREIDQFDFCPADTDILKELKRQYETRQPL